MDRVLSDRAVKLIVLVIGIILVVDVVNVFVLGGPSVFSLIFKSGNTVSASEVSSSTNVQANGVLRQTEGNISAAPSPGSSSGNPQAIYVPTKATPVPTVRYVTEVTPIQVGTSESTLKYIAPTAEPTQDQDAYALIYSNDLSYPGSPTAVAFKVAEPPLVIKYTVSPNMTTDRILIYNHTATHPGADELINATRPSESAWFTVTIYDRASGKELEEDGYGKLHSILTDKTFTVRDAGDYLIQFDGENAQVHVDMLLKKEGNIG
jgi:hypothetical protein